MSVASRDVGDEGDRLAGAELLAHRRQEFAALLVGEEAAGDLDDRRLGVQILKQAALAARHGKLGELPRFRRAHHADARDFPVAQYRLHGHDRSTPSR